MAGYVRLTFFFSQMNNSTCLDDSENYLSTCTVETTEVSYVFTQHPTVSKLVSFRLLHNLLLLWFHVVTVISDFKGSI